MGMANEADIINFSSDKKNINNKRKTIKIDTLYIGGGQHTARGPGPAREGLSIGPLTVYN